MRKAQLLAVMALAVSGCAAQKYVPPTSGDGAVARVRFDSVLVPAMFYRLRDPCHPWGAPDLVDGAERITVFTMFGNRSRTVLGMPMAASAISTDFHETRFRANEAVNLVALLTGAAGGPGGCSIGVQFTPEVGKDYQVNFEMAPHNMCRLSVRELLRGDGTTGSLGAVPIKRLEKCAMPQAPNRDPGGLRGL